MKQSIYFERYAYPRRFISAEMESNTFLCIVIPVYKEPNLIETIASLYNCKQPKHKVEIILVINHPDNADKSIKELSVNTVALVHSFIAENSLNWVKCHVIEAFDLPTKKAGVGLARKIGMDEAAYRLNQIEKDGIIVCFDADSICDQNYLKAIETAFLDTPTNMGASIHYEHPIYNKEGDYNKPIINYEIHLRYYIQALAYSGYPYAFHTIGSSMAVRSSMYQKSGGMNTRKAGEDFYFLHKIIPLGGFINITDTTIVPSSRESDRVPFGTGKAIKDNNNNIKLLGYTYDFRIFKELRIFFELVNTQFNIQSIPPNIKAFLKKQYLFEELVSIAENAKSEYHFQDRFYLWFNGFKVLKCVHYLKENHYPDVSITIALEQLFKNDLRLEQKKLSNMDSYHYLMALRNFEKELNYIV